MDKIWYKRENFEPDFGEILKVFKREVPSRPTLFEYAMNDRVLGKLSGIEKEDKSKRLAPFKRLIKAFTNAGYDFTTISAWRCNTFSFPKNDMEEKASRSLNAGNLISDRKSFEEYAWPDASKGDYDLYHDIGKELPDGMKLVASGNGGLLENVIDICGFENISLLSMLDEELTGQIFDMVGERLLKFYEIVSSIDAVGACIVNDDWGFKNQTMFPPDTLRRWVFPWHKKMVEVIQSRKKIAILHSCGQVGDVMDDVIEDMRYDAKHSYEDMITPVERAYEKWGEGIAILGGIDMDFLSRRSEKEIRDRSIAMLEKSGSMGGYALGSGNSIPDYVPDNNLLAMISSVKYL